MALWLMIPTCSTHTYIPFLPILRTDDGTKNSHERKVTHLIVPGNLVVIANKCPPTSSPWWGVGWYDDSWEFQVSPSVGTWWFFNWSYGAQRLQSAQRPEGKNRWVIHEVRRWSASIDMLLGRKKKKTVSAHEMTHIICTEEPDTIVTA